MNKSLLLTILGAFLFCGSLLARTTKIEGKAEAFKSYQMKAFMVEEYLTKTMNEVATITTSKTGEFDFEVEISEVQYLLLDFGKVKRYLYIEPGKTYKVAIDNISEEIGQSLSLYATDEQPVTILNADSTELNNLIQKLEADVALFTLKNQITLLHRPDKEKVDDFAAKINRDFPVNSSNFFSIYVEYTLAQLYQVTYKSSPDLFAFEFIVGKATYPNNPAYMRVFKNEFEGYLKNHMDRSFSYRIYGLINDNQFNPLMDEVYIIDGDYGNQFKELLLLYLFYENYGSPYLKPESVANMIGQIQRTSISKSNKLVATHILRRIKELTPGSAAPDFALYDQDSNIVHLSNFIGKNVYLGFAETWSRQFEADIKIIQKWKDKYPELEIVTIIVDEDRLAYESFLEQYNPDWTVIHAGLVPTVTLDYKLNNYPSYYLVGADGRLIFSPAKSPYERFENQYLNYLKNQ